MHCVRLNWTAVNYINSFTIHNHFETLCLKPAVKLKDNELSSQYINIYHTIHTASRDHFPVRHEPVAVCYGNTCRICEVGNVI